MVENASLITAKLAPDDEWPENDQLQIRLPPPVLSERWWIGADAPAGFKTIQELPTDSAAYLTPSLIVLNNVPAGAFSQTQLERLEQYVRQVGPELGLHLPASEQTSDAAGAGRLHTRAEVLG